MRSKGLRLLSVLVVLALTVLAGAAPGLAADPGGTGYQAERAAAPIDGEIQQGIARLQQRGVRVDRVSVIIQLAGAPAAETYLAAKRAGASKASLAAAQKTRLSELKAQQTAASAAVTATGAKVIQTYDRLLNGLLVHARPDQLDTLARLPGVTAVRAAPVYQRMLSESVPFIGAEQVRTSLGLDGRGTTIAIVDSGIDYTHRAFGGPGTVEAYEVAISDTSAITETYNGTVLFPTLKVIGGYDFIGERYDPYSACPPEDEAAGQCSTVPQPDADPIDLGGHGTHVASTAAGYAVPNDSVNGSLPSSFEGSEIYHGVAPAARLYAYKVFGPAGAFSDLIAGGVERAMDPNQDGDMSDHVDVVNMSLGAPFAGVDALAEMSARASQVGVLVASSAGNSGDRPYVAGSSAGGLTGITVASSYASGQFSNAVRANSPASIAGTLYQALQQTWAPQLSATGPITGEVVYIGRACPGDALEANPAGKIALIVRGVCAASLKASVASGAGAIAALIYDNADALLPPSFSSGGGTVTVPTLTLTRASGLALRNAASQGVVNVSLSADIRVELTDVISSFSSRGPDVEGTLLKPDITAPGSNITAAGMGTGDGPATLSGTSMASPHIAGALALMRQMHPDWSVQEIIALLMNTANPNLFLSASRQPDVAASISRMGSGRVDLVQAAASETVVYDPQYGGSASFGFQAVVDRFNGSKTIRITNKSAETRSYDLSWTWWPTPTNASLITVGLSQPSVTLAPGASADVQINLSLPAEALPSYGLVNQNANVPALLNRSEINGFIYIRQQGQGGDNLHLPFYMLGRRASTVTASAASVSLPGFGANTTANVTLTNASRNPTTTEVFALVASDPDEPSGSNNTDIQHLGVRLVQEEGSPPRLDFGIHTWTARAVALAAVNVVHLDVNRDGTQDYQLVNFDLGLGSAGSLSGQNASFLCPASVNVDIVFLNGGAFPEDCIAEYYTGFSMNSANTILSMDAPDADLDASTPFNFYVTTIDYLRDYDRYSDRVPDSGWITVNPAAMRFATDETSYTVPANGSATVKISANLSGFLGGDAAGMRYQRGFLLLHSDNAPGAREADVVTVGFPFQFTAFEQDVSLAAQSSGYVSNRQLLSENFGRFFGSSDIISGEDARTDQAALGVVTFTLPGQNVTLQSAQLRLTVANTDYLDSNIVEAEFGARLVDASNITAQTYASLWGLPAKATLTPTLDDDALKGAVGSTQTFTLNGPTTLRGGQATFLVHGDALAGYGRAFVIWHGAGSAQPPTLRILGFTCTGGACP